MQTTVRRVCFSLAWLEACCLLVALRRSGLGALDEAASEPRAKRRRRMYLRVQSLSCESDRGHGVHRPGLPLRLLRKPGSGGSALALPRAAELADRHDRAGRGSPALSRRRLHPPRAASLATSSSAATACRS